MSKYGVINPDLVKERANAKVNVQELKNYLGSLIYLTPERHQKALQLRTELVSRVKPIAEENFYNLERDQKFQMVCKKSLELIDFVFEKNIEDLVEIYFLSAVLGPEKPLFNLHFTMFRNALELWGTKEQDAYWKDFMKKNCIFGSYIQTELGHGTFIRGLETTASYDKKTQEFVLDSPTLTATKFWPGASGKTCNFGIVMAKLFIDGKDNGIHAFVVQLRSLVDHTSVPGLEVGDIGRKLGFDATDNGFMRFNKVRIPRNNMLMQFANVSPDGKFERTGSELLMYATMLLMRGTLCQYGSFFLSISTTIAVRYSAVRHQTANASGIEPQIIDYQTQQYRIFTALAATYALSFSGWKFSKHLNDIQRESNSLKNVKPADLAKLHALSCGLKSVVFGDCLKYAQSNRLCCGGHGYHASAGLGQIIQEADAGSTYEGDNVVLFLQTARYLLKCAQKGISPHLEVPNIAQIKTSNFYKQFQGLIESYSSLYDELINEAGMKMLSLIKEKGLSELDAWNQSSSQLIHIARIYTEIYVIMCNLSSILSHNDKVNQQALADLFELYLLFGIYENYSGSFLRMNVITSNQITEYQSQLFHVLNKIRPNAVALVDSFDMLDSSLCSSLGAYDGNAYERLYEFAKNSQFNNKDVHDIYPKYLKPYALKQKQSSKL